MGTDRRRPNDQDWEAALYQFRVLRDFEDAAILQRARQLPAVLRVEASPIYEAADTLDRTLSTNANLMKFQASVILSRIEVQGYANDQLWDHVRRELSQHLLERITESPSALRQRAHALHNAADDAQAVLDQFDANVQMIRERGEPGEQRNRRYGSVAMYLLIAATDRWGSTLTEIAKRLADAGVPSESDSDDPDPVAQWKGILKQGRARARRRRTQGTQ